MTEAIHWATVLLRHLGDFKKIFTENITRGNDCWSEHCAPASFDSITRLIGGNLCEPSFPGAFATRSAGFYGTSDDTSVDLGELWLMVCARKLSVVQKRAVSGIPQMWMGVGPHRGWSDFFGVLFKRRWFAVTLSSLFFKRRYNDRSKSTYSKYVLFKINASFIRICTYLSFAVNK